MRQLIVGKIAQKTSTLHVLGLLLSLLLFASHLSAADALDKTELNEAGVIKADVEKVNVEPVHIEKVHLEKINLEKVNLEKVNLEKVHLKKDDTSLNLYDEISYFLDESRQLTLQQVINQPFVKTEQSNDSNLSFGYTNANAWVQVRLANQSQMKDWLVEVGYPILDEVELFLVHQGNLIEHSKTGDHFPLAERPFEHRNFVFPVTLKDNQEYSLYLKVASSSSLRIPLTLWQEKAFFEADQYRIMKQGVYFGILIIMMLYNLFIFFSIKEKAYLHYVFYVASYIIVQASINGFLGQLAPELPDVITDKSTVLSLSLVILFGCSFSLSFLNLKFNHLVAYRVLTAMAILGGANFLLAIFLPYSISIKAALILAVAGALLITFFGFVLWLHYGIREARFFSIAWAGFLLGSILMMLSRLHLLADNFITENAAQLGSSFEVMLLSFALADKFSQMRGEKELVETRAKESLAQVNTLLTETMIRLEKSNAIKSDFLATVSHELRTPMNGIIASNELLKIAELPEETKEYIEISENSSKQMMELIDSMLQFVEIQSGQANLKKELIDIDCLFAEVGDSIRADYADKKIKFQADLPNNFKPELYTDYQKLLQIIEELVDNAFKFTAAGNVNLGVQLLGEDSLADIEFFVTDTGIGIEEEHQGKIFDAFYLVDSTSKRKYGGIGMGLTTAQSLANILGGVISVESSYGEGSKFKLRLPLYSLKA